MAMLLWSGLAGSVRADEQTAAPRYDRAVLSEMARDVLRPPATRPEHSRAKSGGSEADAREEAVELGTGDDPVSPVTHIAPAQEGVTVAIPPGLAPAANVISGSAPVDYHSNTWRQRPAAPRGLSFSSGVRAVGSGLDPALRADTHKLAAQGRDVVYGFLLFRVPLDESLERTLAGLGVQLLGPHDDHHKARMPVALLETIAALPEVEWVGVSSRQQKQSRQLAELRAPAAGVARIDGATPVPIVINLFEADRDGAFRRELEDAGVSIGQYDAHPASYGGVATGPTIDRIAALDFVLFVEMVQRTFAHHDQSMPLIDADLIRPGTPLGLTRFGAATVTVGILDTGFMIGDAAPVMHWDLDKNACGLNFTTDAAGTFHDENGHGTHVLATMVGTGASDPRYRGMATAAGTIEELRVAKVLDKNKHGFDTWTVAGMDFMSGFSLCESAPPLVINVSLGSGDTDGVGTDRQSRRLDDMVWLYGQLYVVSAGNRGSAPQTIDAPGVAKNALTVGNVFDRQYLGVGDIAQSSSRGPTGDGRMKPNVVAPGNKVTSAKAGTTNSYTDKEGTSMAAPHVTGLAATLMDHYPYLRGRPALLRSHLMATAIPHNDVTGKSDDYGLGRVSGYLAHWSHTNNDGWSSHWFDGGINSFGFAYGDVTVPPGTQRLVVVLTWDEPSASSGASRAVTYNLDLWADHNIDCGDPSGACGEFSSRSDIDNVEYLVIDNPPAGSYRLKVVPVNAPTFQLRYGMTAMIIRGDPTPAMTAVLTPPATSPVVGSIFEVKMSVYTPAYVASGVQIQPKAPLPSGLTLRSVQTKRFDGASMAFSINDDTLTLGNALPTYPRQASYFFTADTPGPKTFFVRAWSENGGEVVANTTFEVQALSADLVPTAMGTSPAAPVSAPGSSFSVTDTVQNVGPGPSVASKTRYYLSLDAVKSADDTLLTGTHSVPGLEAGASHTATVTVTIPAGTALNAYFLLACADDQSAVAEESETNNCIATPGAIVTVARPDLAATVVTTTPAAPARTPGATFSVTDTVRNAGAAAAGGSTTRYYLSLDGVKNAGDTLLTGSRPVPSLAGGASQSGTVTVTIPAATPLNSYYVLACADDLNAVVEGDDGNNCIATPGAIVTVARPDLAATAVTPAPAVPVRAPGTTFSVTDTVQNLGLAPSGASTTRYYLSLDPVKNTGDTLLAGSRPVPSLAGGASQSGTVTVTIPAATPLHSYYLLACADDLNAVVEVGEGDNCVATASAVVTVTRPDLAQEGVSSPPTTKARGTTFAVTDTVHNVGPVPSGASSTRYYLSLDAVKGTGDLLLTGGRTVPGLAAGATQSGSATLTIPSTTPLNTYFVLACADATNTVVETDEANNCAASATTVTVTP
jgi:subtilase family serine protease